MMYLLKQFIFSLFENIILKRDFFVLSHAYWNNRVRMTLKVQFIVNKVKCMDHFYEMLQYPKIYFAMSN